mmetsp:Transcript_63110/g.150461  ORF Transcript_63110/g.150461 Transcript_63110/m.150461 type:complete len:82 (-) Transcript_63110:379-624(-)
MGQDAPALSKPQSAQNGRAGPTCVAASSSNIDADLCGFTLTRGTQAHTSTSKKRGLLCILVAAEVAADFVAPNWSLRDFVD